MKTLYELYKELMGIKNQVTDMQIPLTIDGKEVESVELLTNPLRVEIKTKKEK